MDWLHAPLTVTPWQLAAGVVVLLTAWAMFPKRSGVTRANIEDAKGRLGLPNHSTGMFFLLAILWATLAALLAAGLTWLIWDVLWHAMLPEAPKGAGDRQETWNFRFRLAQLVALTTVLGAVAALPLTLIQMNLKRQANRTADEALFNDKIAEAAADLHARRQSTVRPYGARKQHAPHDLWEDDFIRRNAAINRLEGLVEERMGAPVEDAAKREVLGRVSRLLSIYVQDLSAEIPARPTPKDRTPDELRQWARGLTPRSDMQSAAQTLGRLRRLAGDLADAVDIDLQGANLQGCRLNGLDFDEGRKRSNFAEARMQGADLRDALMQGADLGWARMDEDTNLTGATLRGAAVKYVDDATLVKLEPFKAHIFADGTVKIPDDRRPTHWVDRELHGQEFENAWRAWQRSIGMDPENPQ